MTLNDELMPAAPGFPVDCTVGPLVAEGTDTSGPVRVTLSRAAGWRMPPNTVKVTRPGPWGNPFVTWYGSDAFGVDRWHVSHGSCHWQAESKEAATLLAVQKHEHWLRSWLADQIVAPHHVLHELRGKNLACWCKAGAPCHADTLLRYANPKRPNVRGNLQPMAAQEVEDEQE